MDHLTEQEKRILSAARQVFLEKGRDGARMQEIANRAGINKALLHYYFRNKEKLYATVLREEIRSFIQGFTRSIPEENTFREFLNQFVHHYLQHIARKPEVIRFLLWELESGGERVGTLFREELQQTAVSGKFFLLARIEQAIQQGEIRSVDPLQLVLSLIGMCLYPFLARPILSMVFPSLNPTSPDFLERRKQAILELIWKGIQPDPSPDANRDKPD
ncbi:MAG: TetR/AcrR family transcriptional regulator [Calditrichaeota bacterium]|nr:TetR/AcrR family transcriptional regulator [Calditrichota bacterium]